MSVPHEHKDYVYQCLLLLILSLEYYLGKKTRFSSILNTIIVVAVTVILLIIIKTKNGVRKNGNIKH